MKKTISIILCVILCSFIFAGCAGGGSEPFEKKTYTPAPDARIRGIDLDVRDREITVEASGHDQVHIQYSENSKEYYDISVSDDQMLTMTAASDKELSDYIGGKTSAEDRKILLQIPDGLLEDLTLSTTNEDITVPGLTVTKNIDLSSNGGNVIFENLDTGSALTLNAKNGNISGTIVGSYDDFAIRSEIKKGDSNLPGDKDTGAKTLDVSCNNGDIEIAFVKQ